MTLAGRNVTVRAATLVCLCVVVLLVALEALFMLRNFDTPQPGPFGYDRLELTLHHPDGSSPDIPPEIPALLYYPTAEGQAQLASGQFPLIVHSPGWGASRHTNQQLLTFLTSHGYVVLSIDDVKLNGAWSGQSSQARAIQEMPYALTSPKGLGEDIRRFDQRTQAQGRKISAALTALERLAQSHSSEPLSLIARFDHVAGVGFSFGGTALAHLCSIDPRLVSVVNLDGGHWGRGADAVPCAYLMIYGLDSLPNSQPEHQRTLHGRREQQMIIRDLQLVRRHISNDNTFVALFPTARHGQFADAPTPSLLRRVLGGGRSAKQSSVIHAMRNAFTLHFLHAYLPTDGDPTSFDPPLDPALAQRLTLDSAMLNQWKDYPIPLGHTD